MVVDPGDASPVITLLKEQGIQLKGILLTHHHRDHTGGVSDLLKLTKVPVYGPDSIPLVTHPVKEGDCLFLDPIPETLKVIEIPGHTLDHVAYVGSGILFCGDTLFTAGCGRVFEGTFLQMYQSLQKLASLPSETKIYCGHEYTQANLRFAKSVEPSNKDIQERIIRVDAQRAEGKPTVPAPLSLELKTNPFLRCKNKAIQSAASDHFSKKLADPLEIFTEIRLWKDRF